jgi:hypothetical protein
MLSTPVSDFYVAVNVERGAKVSEEFKLSKLFQFIFSLAEEGGFEPPVPFPVRQFSKLLV